MELVSLSAYARHRGVSHTAVDKAVATGRISSIKVGKRRKVNPAVADQEWDENTDRSKPRNSVEGAPSRRRLPGEPSVPMDLDGKDGGNGGAGVPAGSGGTGYGRARAAREAYNAALTKLKLEEETGILVRREDVRLAAFNAARRARDQLIAIPERLGAVLAATESTGDVVRILEDEIERICQELSGGSADGK